MEDATGAEISSAAPEGTGDQTGQPSEAAKNSDTLHHHETESPPESKHDHTNGNQGNSITEGDQNHVANDGNDDDEHEEGDEDEDNEDGSDDESDDEPPVESLVAGRVRRNNAGNLMAKALAAEDDGDTDLLFAEEGEDEEFEAVPDQETALADDDDSDDDSSDDEENQAQDDLAGERELMKQERAEKRASAKRKAVGPQPLRKRVKIAGDASKDATQAPKRRLKKSERTSWLPSEGDAPTRVSSRKLAIENKVRTLESLKESTKRAAVVREKMKISDARKKALERPPMTQEERLEEAARTEKLNLKSVKRWEQQESDRLARQRAELEKLRNKKLEGPIIRWYSGPCEWDYKNRLHRIGRPKKSEKDAAIVEVQTDVAEKQVPPVDSTEGDSSKAISGAISAQEDVPMLDVPASDALNATETPTVAAIPETNSAVDDTTLSVAVQAPSAEGTSENASSTDAVLTNEGTTGPTEANSTNTEDSQIDAPIPNTNNTETEPSPPILDLTSQDQPVEAAPEHDQIPAEQIKEELDPAVAPGPDAEPTQLSPQATTETPSITKEAVPTEAPGLLDGIEEYASMPPEAPSSAAAEDPASVSLSSQAPQPSTSTQTNDQSQSSIADNQAPVKPATTATATVTPAPPPPPPPPKEPPPPPRAGQAQTLTLLSFDNAVLTRQPEAVRRIVLHSTIPNPASSTSRASNAIHLAALRPAQPLCAITSLPARYRDPLTGLAYRDREAFKVLRDTVDGCLYDESEASLKPKDALAPPERGRYGPRWSTLLGAWVGREGVSARNVPLGFVHGTTPVPLPAAADGPVSGPDGGVVGGGGGALAAAAKAE